MKTENDGKMTQEEKQHSKISHQWTNRFSEFRDCRERREEEDK